MTERDPNALPVLPPNLQVSFYARLQSLERLYLQEALRKTVQEIDLTILDDELSKYVERSSLTRVAAQGLRGEVFFPTPHLLRTNPFLLGYYRLLFGLSQKEFYNKGPFGRFKRLEEEGEILKQREAEIPALCKSLIGTAQLLLEEIDDLSLRMVRDLQILTLGPQLRGSRNTQLGQEATQEIFDLIETIVSAYIIKSTTRTIHLRNDSQRVVVIEFFSDPDVSIRERLSSGSLRPLVAMEIKGGTDVSNIHNRLGEAEKSHQKAKVAGFLEFWTIVNVDVSTSVAKQDSPTTSHFFYLDRICDPSTSEYQHFVEMLSSLLGIQS
jgi:hypothetical protein